jgi:hypothetical protein
LGLITLQGLGGKREKSTDWLCSNASLGLGLCSQDSRAVVDERLDVVEQKERRFVDGDGLYLRAEQKVKSRNRYIVESKR